MSRRPCAFYNTPGGCRRGNECSFEHGPANEPGSSHTRDALRGSQLGRGRGRGRGRGGWVGGESNRPHSPSSAPQSSSSSAHFGSAPPGVCREFWSSGTCKHEFKCRYRHEQPPGRRNCSPSSTPNEDTTAIARLAPFLTEAGLERLAGPGVDAYTSLPVSGSRSFTPTEAQTHLRVYLYNDYRFRGVQNIYSLGKILHSANAMNTSWTQEDGQLLLSALATGNGLLRLIDVILWPKVSMQAGQSREILSFQRGYFPVLRYLSSDFVARSTLSHLVNALYSGLIMENFEYFSSVVQECMDNALSRKTFKDIIQSTSDQVGGSQILACLCSVLFEVLTRFKNAMPTYKGLRPLVLKLRDWTNAWVRGVSASPATFNDVIAGWDPIMRETTVEHLKTKIDPLVAIVDREQSKIDKMARRNESGTASSSLLDCDDAIAAALLNAYEGPGEDHANGPRHDNDFVDMDRIRTIPTHDELSCRLPPFLPANIYGAPHPFPPESPQKLLDIQFRLLREELTAPLRTSAQLVMDDLRAPPNSKTRLQEIISKGGGKYRSYADKLDSIMFNVYTEVKFSSLEPDHRGLAVTMSLNAPPGRASSPQAKSRVHFWEGAAGKRLMQGGLLALVWKCGRDITVHLGVVASSSRDLTESAKQSPTRVTIRVVFFDSAIELRILQALKYQDSERQGFKILVEAPVMFEAIRPFLEALRTEPETVPFARYLVHHPRGYLAKLRIEPPAYSRRPGFGFKMDCLFDKEAGVENLVMDPRDAHSVEAARDIMKKASRLDPSQANSVVDALTREVALIQGPPGTGKSYTGVELLRVLVANKVRPILMIAFTNHALDHLLRSVLETNVTQRIVRLGSRSNDEKIAKLNIESLEMLAGQSRLDREFASHHRALKMVQQELRDLMNDFLKVSIETESIVRFIEIRDPSLWESLVNPPEWVSILHQLQAEDNQGYQTVGRRGQATNVDNSLYAFWRRTGDLDFIASLVSPPRRSAFTSIQTGTRNRSPRGDNKFDVLRETDMSDPFVRSETPDEELVLAPEEEWMGISYSDEEDLVALQTKEETIPEEADSKLIAAPGVLQASDLCDPTGFFAFFGLPHIPSLPTGNRPVDELLDQHDIWSLSKAEREKLHAAWEEQLRTELYENQVADFERLRRRHSEVLQEYNEGKQESRRNLLQNVDIIGCTTTGAAKLTALLKSIAPRVLLVEEAGQVLEAHVLGSLVPSIQHLIMIGDPLQLRPTLNNFGLSMNSRQGAQLYRFDMSLMERLSSGGLPMSRIDIQRRMRPSIANLIRNTLYPTLEDHDLVRQYPPVRGFAQNVFFFSHNHAESGGDDSGKYNTFEVEMIKDLVKYLLRQGCYSNEGDIVVLCAYLGQLARMRDALSDEITVVIDERDQELLAEREEEAEGAPEEKGVAVEHMKISKRVRLRTIDNYQGEEAEIVILSLVRNSGGSDEDDEPLHRTNIGFLKSENRTNVALSRAKQGLFIMGNAQNLSLKSKMWRSILFELESSGAVGGAFPIACQRHPDRAEYVSEPGQLPRVAPDGGCMQACDARLSCGHVCPYKCHSDDPRHVSVVCSQPCRRLCSRNHPCPKQCSTLCDQCMYQVADVELPCGHRAQSVPCYMLDRLSDVYCTVSVKKQLPTCEHLADMRCSQDPASHQCRSICGGTMSCCGRPCKSFCFECQGRNTPAANLSNPVEEEDAPPVATIQRKSHVEHPCERTLPCEHRCQQACSENHECTRECKEPCRQVCVHARCKNYCSTPCSPCQEQCTWACAHYTCPVPCGSVCARLPCDKRCDKMLSCSHRCPSVCGEDCSIQICPVCATEDEKSRIVDFIMQETLGNVDPDQETLDQLLITLPNCRHVFTVETLDGLCDIKAYYNEDGKWLSLKQPPPGFMKPPVCPTCRAAITAPRYGRVFKRADLDILEKNVANRMARSLSSISDSMAVMSKADMENQLKEEAKKVQVASVSRVDERRKERQKKRQGLLDAKRDTPVTRVALDPQAVEWHGLSPADAGPWKKVVRPLLQAYEQAVRLSETRSAHINAWESAFSCLVQRELDVALTDPSHAPRNPREHAMRMARMLVGQPKPQADKRFCVEAFWVTINVRFTLADLAQTWMDTLKNGGKYPEKYWQMWGMYRRFLLQTCLCDAKIVLDIATQSGARRQMTTTSLLIMRAELEMFRLNIKMNQDSGIFNNNQRDKLLRTTTAKREEAASYRLAVIKAHVQKIRDQSEADWLRENFARIAETICEEWGTLENAVRTADRYEPVSLDEQMSVIKAFKQEFGYGGHYYTCPNGHIYVIADCGGANQVSRCPECGAQVGGSGHNLLSGNRRAEDMERLATQEGYRESPWQWGRA